jgi:hypothetical protein
MLLYNQQALPQKPAHNQKNKQHKLTDEQTGVIDTLMTTKQQLGNHYTCTPSM